MERNTRQKEFILNVLQENEENHITAEDIFKKLDGSVSKATLYRELGRLCEKGILRKYVIGDKIGACYQYVENVDKCQSHYHLLCDKCDKLIHTEIPVIDNVKKNLVNKEGFEVDMKNLVFHGICKNCKKKENKNK